VRHAIRYLKRSVGWNEVLLCTQRRTGIIIYMAAPDNLHKSAVMLRKIVGAIKRMFTREPRTCHRDIRLILPTSIKFNRHSSTDTSSLFRHVASLATSERKFSFRRLQMNVDDYSHNLESTGDCYRGKREKSVNAPLIGRAI